MTDNIDAEVVDSLDTPGARIEEIFGMETTDIKGSVWHVQRVRNELRSGFATKDITKTSKARFIPMHPLLTKRIKVMPPGRVFSECRRACAGRLGAQHTRPLASTGIRHRETCAGRSPRWPGRGCRAGPRSGGTRPHQARHHGHLPGRTARDLHGSPASRAAGARRGLVGQDHFVCPCHRLHGLLSGKTDNYAARPQSLTCAMRDDGIVFGLPGSPL